jgi:hypothetical protein
MSHRPSTPRYVNYTDADGNIYQLTMTVDALGNAWPAASSQDIEKLLQHAEDLLTEQRLTNLYLSALTGQHFAAPDLEDF